jgi:hypothetical protein
MLSSLYQREKVFLCDRVETFIPSGEAIATGSTGSSFRFRSGSIQGVQQAPARDSSVELYLT